MLHSTRPATDGTSSGITSIRTITEGRPATPSAGGKTMTLGIAIQSRIEEIVAQWVREGKMFTAFEVSLALKEEGVRERHRNMREFVHQSIFRAGIARGDYSRTLMDVGAPEQAWVYHSIGSNPYEYEPLERSGHERPRVKRDGV